VKVDGATLGLAGDVVIDGNQLTVKRGIFPIGTFFTQWFADKTTKPELDERHDLTLIGLQDLKLTELRYVARRTDLTALSTQPTDDPTGSCVYIESASLTAESVTKVADAQTEP
jgi:hypothetical protein